MTNAQNATKEQERFLRTDIKRSGIIAVLHLPKKRNFLIATLKWALMIMDTVTINLPNRPVITVHKGWTPSKKRGHIRKPEPAVDQGRLETNISILPRKGKTPAANPPEGVTPRSSTSTRPRKTGQRIEFINNATQPLNTRDVAVRKLVRSHVMREVARERREQKKAKLKDADGRCEEAKGTEGASSTSERGVERLSGDVPELVPAARDQSALSFSLGQEVNHHLTGIPSKVKANIRRLETLYFTQLGNAMFPMEFHLAYKPPKQLLALDISMTDDAVFQALLYAAAVCSTLAEGRSDSSDVTVHMSLTIRLINRLIESGMGMGDGMLGAVVCLAMGEALRGQFDDWAVHMTGLKKMVEIRGGMDRINFYLQMKLYRADLIGSIDQVIRPFFHFDRSHRPAIYSNPYHLAYDTLLDWPTARMELRALLPCFANVLTELRDLSRAMEQTLVTPDARLDPKDFIEACYSIQHQLLPSGPVEVVSDYGHISSSDELGEAFRLGAIIYTKEILQDFTFSATGSRILVSKLRNSLNPDLKSQATPTLLSLLLWLLVMGGVASAKDSMDRTFFVAHLVRLQREIGVDGWEDVKKRLESVLWIGKVLDKAGKGLWEEVKLTRRVLG